jgi:hypothetical protein
VPPYQTVDVTYQSGHQGDANYYCLNTPGRVQNAVVTFNARNTTCGGRTITGVSTTAGSNVLTSTNGNFTSADVTPTNSPVVAVGNPNFLQSQTKISSITDANHAVMNRTATATVTNRSVTIGTVCGTVDALLDVIGICVCLWSVPTQAVSQNPACNPAVQLDAAWQVNHGNKAVGNMDCTNGNASNPKDGIFAPGDPTLVGSTTCQGDGICPQSTHVRFLATDVDVSHTLALSGFTWPAAGAVEAVSLRVSHVEQSTNMAIAVAISFPGSDCAAIVIPTNTTGVYVEDALLLPAGCAPDTQAKMAATTVTYTVTCGAGVACKPGSKPYAFLDALVFDLNYQLGGAGGTPAAHFAAQVAGTPKVEADVTFGEDTVVDSWKVD